MEEKRRRRNRVQEEETGVQLCKRKKGEENEKWERKAKEARRENKVWEVVNKKRKKRRRVNEGIQMKEWKKHFMRLLGGVEIRMIRGEKRGRTIREEEEEISVEEIRKAGAKLRDGKAMELDDIPGEVWKYGREEIVK